MLKESRLIGVTYDQLKKTQQKTGASPVLSGTSQRSADTNAKSQEQTRAAQLNNLQTTGQSVAENAQANQALVASKQVAAPVVKPVTPTTSGGALLTQTAEQRRRERLTGLGIQESEYNQVNDMINKGYTMSGTENGRAVFTNAQGQKWYSPLNETSTKDAVDIAGTNFDDEIAGEQKQQDDQLKADIMAKEAEGADTTVTGETATPPVNPATAGFGAALANLPPEAQFLAGPLQQFADSINQSLQQNAQITQGTLAGIDQTYGGIQEQLNSMQEGYRASTEAMQGILEDAKEQNDQMISEQEKAAADRLAWTEASQARDITRAKRADHDAMVAQIALSGGFGQDAGLRAVMESDATYDQKMWNLQTEMGIQRTELSAKFTALYNENNNNYVNSTLTNMKELRGALERIGMQGISNATARQQAEQKAIESAWTNQTSLRTTLANKNLDTAWQIQGVIKEAKQEKIDKEDRALKQISSLLSQFPENEVREIVLGLGKDVTSFSVEQMLNAKSNDEIEAARRSALARQQAAGMALMQKQQNAPLITYDEFIKQKIAEKEQASGMSMSEKSRSEYLAANKSLFDSQFDQYTSPNFQNLTSGNPNVDAATDALIRGDFSTIKEAAKAYRVADADVATYAGILRNRGAQVGDIRALQPEQAKELATLRKTIDDNDVTKKLNVMDSAIPKIGVARNSLTGVGDVALLNFYQNGIVDPGLAVRAEDANLLRKASALRDKITTQFAEEVLLEGAFFPDETRAEMERIAKGVYEATQRVYNEKVYAPTVEQASLSGIGEPYFNYKKRQPVNAQGASADSYISTYGF